MQNQYTILFPQEIMNDFESFTFLISMISRVSNINNSDIIFDFKNTNWFEANLTAILGVAFIIGFKNNNKVYMKDVSKNIKAIFSKNNFYTTYGLEGALDTYNSTIKYTIFQSNNRNEFSKYIKNELIPKIRVRMSDEFEKVFRIALEELFQNARVHGKCDSIITCGQYFHSNARVKFTIIDLGMTILENVRLFLGDSDMLADAAIDWATIEGNSTRDSEETGGIGISFIRDFLSKNFGKIQIISSDGYWEEHGGKKLHRCIDCKMPGTIVNIEVNINDWNIYLTSSEIEEDKNSTYNIF